MLQRCKLRRIKRSGNDLSQWASHTHHAKQGTKGKGSTCAWAESYLRAHGKRTGFPDKTGLYTSPHLVCPEERVRIDFEPLCKGEFARYFFEVWSCLVERNDEKINALPRYHQLLLIVALHAFISEGVEAAIIETHHGGEYDATNVISRPVVTVITSLGMDHVEQLGPTIENIAWHKSGIFKNGAHAFSAPQESASAAEVLRHRAADNGVPIQFVSADESLLPAGPPRFHPPVQVLNCSVALAAARDFLRQRAPRVSSQGSDILNEDDIQRAVEGFSWPGRFQVVVEENHEWFLDSAHNEMSVSKASGWFIESISGDAGPSLGEKPKRALIFGQSHNNNRDPVSVLDSLAVCLKPIHFDKVIFTLSYDRDQLYQARRQDTGPEDGELLGSFEKTWRKHYPDSDVVQVGDVEQAMTTARDSSAGAGGRTQTLITGCLLLVGEALSVLNGGTVV
ncbi:hypothetical protein INS49_007269 [Diaporthe citri]|uniref:uncharacterized protein n=1 Tax=Diaporthe citri TaxID=83186 RepID=UPI001C7E9BC0|nr:uncharacterized protein INS49_007269 [Diaporthe citri]KAG6365658.1 hypothetical protein INS49_007269 [Diaporthe citri]